MLRVSSESLLLPPRSALLYVPFTTTRKLLHIQYTPLPFGASVQAQSSSIFRTAEFGGYVVTRFLPDNNFHVYRPTVYIRLRLL